MACGIFAILYKRIHFATFPKFKNSLIINRPQGAKFGPRLGSYFKRKCEEDF